MRGESSKMRANKGVEMEKESKGYYVGIPIGEGEESGYAHVTIAIRQICSPEDVARMTETIKSRLKPLLPLVLRIEKIQIMLGYKNDVPAHRVHFVHPEHRIVIEGFYREFYNQTPGHTEYPELSAHVAVGGEERKKTIDKILDGQNGVYVACAIQMKQLGDKKVLFEVESF